MSSFKSHTSFDYETKRHLSYLSRARSIIKKVENLLIEDDNDLNLSSLDILQSRVKFAAGFNKICLLLSPNMNVHQ